MRARAPKAVAAWPVARHLRSGVWECGGAQSRALPPRRRRSHTRALRRAGRCDPAESPSSQIFALTLPPPPLPTPSRRVGGASLHSARGLQHGAGGVGDSGAASPLPAPLPALLLAAACCGTPRGASSHVLNRTCVGLGLGWGLGLVSVLGPAPLTCGKRS